MPIGDLLASISGGKQSAGSATPLKRTNSVPAKRKPDVDLHNDSAKAPRRVPSPSRTTPSSKPGSYTGSAMRSGGSTPSSTLAIQTSKATRPGVPSTAGAAPAVQSPSAAPKAPPKKGSFAEILARGQRAQVSMGQVGRIQHKKVEKGSIKRPEPDARGPKSNVVKNKAGASGSYAGTSKSAPRNGMNGNKASALAGRPDARPMGKSKAKVAAEEEEANKKVKKAAQATTGYTGTARPKVGKPARKNDTPRGGALLNTSRPAASSRSRYEDDYDEELDDFIEYDDDEDEGGPRYGYASDGSSDMEAGLDDIDLEERRAEFIGRREDQEEERIERTLKQAKEERKRKALDALRANRR